MDDDGQLSTKIVATIGPRERERESSAPAAVAIGIAVSQIADRETSDERRIYYVL